MMSPTFLIFAGALVAIMAWAIGSHYLFQRRVSARIEREKALNVRAQEHRAKVKKRVDDLRAELMADLPGVDEGSDKSGYRIKMGERWAKQVDLWIDARSTPAFFRFPDPQSASTWAWKPESPLDLILGPPVVITEDYAPRIIPVPRTTKKAG